MSSEDIFPNRPLYKYLSTSPGVSPSWKERLRQLLDGSAYYPSPRDFNDPFDCLPYVILPATQEEFEAKKNILIERVAQASEPYDLETRIRILRESLEGRGLDEISNLIRISMDGTASRLGIFCLAETIDSVLMWSHYASNHRGLAVQFDLSRQWRGGLMPMFKVNYQSVRPVLGEFFDGLVPTAIADAMAIKADFWRYEQEWRSIRPEAARTVVSLIPRL
jgi:hypothetical protein